MDINKLVAFYYQIVEKITSAPETAYDEFIKVWTLLTYEEKEVLKPFFYKFYLSIFDSDEMPIENKMFMTEIEVTIGLENEGNKSITHLNLTESVKDVQIAKIFYDLKKSGKIDNSLFEIAKAISQLFNLNFDTMLSYLNNPSRFDKSQPLTE